MEALLEHGQNIDVNSTIHTGKPENHYTFRYEMTGNYSKMDTALHIACRNGNKQLVELLLSHGANVNSKTSGFRSPISLAIEESHDGIHFTTTSRY